MTGNLELLNESSNKWWKVSDVIFQDKIVDSVGSGNCFNTCCRCVFCVVNFVDNILRLHGCGI